MAELPLDIPFTIFSKLPIKSLMQFKSLSKQWHSIISRDTCFAAMQMNNQNSEDARILLLGRSSDCSEKHGELDGGLLFKINLNRIEKGGRSKNAYYQLQGSCNGLLFFTKNFDEKEAVLYNPLTQEVSAFPCPKPWFPAPAYDLKYGFGFDSLSGKYKILRIFSRRREEDDPDSWINVAAEVSSLEGSGNSWRAIEKFPSRPFRHRMVYIGGALHCASTDEFSGGLILVSFLLDKEEFISSTFPDLLCVKLAEIGGLLGIVDLSSRSKIEIWVQKKLGGEWIKEYKIDITAPEGLPDNSLAEVIGIWKNDEVLLSYYPNNFVSYDRKSDTLKFIELPAMESDAGIISHRGSLVSVPRFSLNNEDS